MARSSTAGFIAMLRWSARISSAALLGMVLLWHLNQFPPNLFRGPPQEVWQQTAFLMAIIGLAVGWLWEGAGGLLVIGGMAVFSAVEYMMHRTLPSGAFPLFWVPGLLFMLTALLADRGLKR